MLNSERFRMTPTKFPNTPKPIFGSCSDGFPKPIVSSVSESSEVICFHEPLLAFQSNQTVSEQVPRQVNQTVSNPKPQFQPDVKPDMTQSFFAVYDPWNEDVDTVDQSMTATSNLVFQDPIPVKVPTLFKVGEDPYDPWNSFVGDVEPFNTPLPCFGGESKPNHKDRVPTVEPHNQPVLLKAGDDIHDPWNIREQLHCPHNLQRPTLQSSSSSFVDTRNAL